MTRTSPERWLADLFEFEYCDECGGDAQHHTVVPGPFGHPFALCSFPPNDTADPLPGDDGPLHLCERFHPTIRAFHSALSHA